MSENEPSSDMDDLFGFGAPDADTRSVPEDSSAPAQQFSSRREAREAQIARDAAAAVDGLRQSAPALHTRREQRARSASNTNRKSSRSIARQDAIRRSSAAQRSGKLSRSERALIRDSAAHGKRKNPLSVLATMAMVGGIFAVAALPAYAMPDRQAELASAKGSVPVSQSMVVSAEALADTTLRDDYRATTPEELAARSRDDLRAANNAAYLASGARELGDDYPWAYELKVSQGGGLSPLNYYYRECVDFVAWRINRDQGSYEAPFKWVWSNLTPYGGNASQWKYSWDRNGWETSDVPIVGSVAWFGWENHVAYVKAVNDDGTVLIEEYNNLHLGTYSQRTIPASSVSSFLYPPS